MKSQKSFLTVKIKTQLINWNKIHLPIGIVKKIGRIEFFQVQLYEPYEPFATQGKCIECDVCDLSPIPLTEEWADRLQRLKK